jgi:hypothetical protein
VEIDLGDIEGRESEHSPVQVKNPDPKGPGFERPPEEASILFPSCGSLLE